jgi:hypothetical protein
LVKMIADWKTSAAAAKSVYQPNQAGKAPAG